MKLNFLKFIVLACMSFFVMQCAVSLTKSGITLFEEQEYALAKEQLLLALDENPQNADALYHLGRISLEENDFVKMKEYYDAATLIIGESTSSNAQLQKLHIENGFQFAFASLYNEGLDYFTQGDSLLVINKSQSDASYSKAMDLFKASVEMTDNPASSLEVIAASYLQLENDEESEKYLEMTLEVKPESFLALYNLASIRIRQAENDDTRRKDLLSEALALYITITEVRPDELSMVIEQMDYCFSQLERYNEAIEFFRQKRETDPENVSVLSYLGKSLFDSGDVSGAHVIFQELSSSNPNDPEIAKRVAYTLWNSVIDKINSNTQLSEQEVNSILPYMERVSELDGTDIVAWESLMILYAQQGQLGIEGIDDKLKNAMERYQELSDILK